MRGLKQRDLRLINTYMGVAPYVGAWIETEVKELIILEAECVAPYVGAWIET